MLSETHNKSSIYILKHKATGEKGIGKKAIADLVGKVFNTRMEKNKL